MISVEISTVRKYYGSLNAVDGVTFSVEKVTIDITVVAVITFIVFVSVAKPFKCRED